MEDDATFDVLQTGNSQFEVGVTIVGPKVRHVSFSFRHRDRILALWSSVPPHQHTAVAG